MNGKQTAFCIGWVVFNTSSTIFGRPKNIYEIFLCLDCDAAGIEACDKLKDILIEKGYEAEKVKGNTLL